ncbi:MAG TPA: polysaccharide lyase family protein [Terracidiphilus sp.]|nr:polysaccharide lyase family protein [Terracidiphilus sp.]
MKKTLLLALMTLALGASAQERELWHIGQFDHSSNEFQDSHDVDYAGDAGPVIYTIGASREADWRRFQPGPANGLAGGRLHPVTIRFHLDSVPPGKYILRIAALYETPRRSTLKLDLNGHQGMLVFHPHLDYSAGDWEGTFVPQTSYDPRTLTLPRKFVKPGENQLTLTALDTPSAVQMSLGDIAPGISGIVYDALAMSYRAGKVVPATPLVQAEATVFFKQAAGGLREGVNICATDSLWPAGPANAELIIAGQKYPVPFEGGTEFGDRCAEIYVPAWQGEQLARVVVYGRTTSILLKAQRRWTVHIVPNEHLDIGFTDYRSKVGELQSRSLDQVLDLLPNHPEFRWTMDGSWVAEQFLATRSPEQQQKLLDAVRAGKIVIPPQYANQHTGVASLEGLIHSLYPSHAMAARYKLPLGAAHITDVPSYSWSYASILHDAGVRYFAAGSNNWRAPILLEGRWNERSPFYWEGPDGGRVLMWYSRAYLQVASMFGVPPKIEAVHDALPVFLEAYNRPGYKSDSVLLFGSQLENTELDPGQVTLPQQWQEQYAYPRLDFSTFADAMQEIEKQSGGSIPVVRGDFGPYWEDGYTADAAATAQHRANQQRIQNAETLAAAVSALRSGVRPEAGLLDAAWRNTLLFDEHTWTYVGAASQPESDQTRIQLEQKTATSTNAAQEIEQSIQRSWAQLEPLMAQPQPAVAVWNRLNWTRDGWLETDLSQGEVLLDPDTRKPLPQVALGEEAGIRLPGFGGRAERVRFRATGVPSMGWRLFPIVSQAQDPQRVEMHGTTLENKFYRVEISPQTASIAHLIDKKSGRDLVDPASPYPFASLVYVTSPDAVTENSLYRYGSAQRLPNLSVHLPVDGKVVSLYRDAEGEHAILESANLRFPLIRTEILLPAGARRIDLRITVHKEATLAKEAAYIAFPFLQPHPRFGYDSQNGWIDPAVDELMGGSREWYAAQHWASVRSAGSYSAVIPVDAPLVALGDIVRGVWPTHFTPKSSAIFSWIMSNYWNTNFPAQQGGTVTFRYSLLTGENFDPAELTRKALDVMTPLEFETMNGTGRAAVPLQSAGSMVETDTDEVTVSTWKLAELREGTVLRVEDISGKPHDVKLTFPQMTLGSAHRCSILEDEQSLLPSTAHEVHLALKPWEIATVCLSPAASRQDEGKR